MIRTWPRPASSQIAFAMLLGCCVTLILRPAELIPALLELPIYEGFIVGSLLFGNRELQRHFLWRNLRQQPTTMCVVGVSVAVIVSHVFHFYLSGAVSAAIDFLKIMVFFGLLVSLTDTVSRLRKLFAIFAVSATVTISLCVADYLEIVDFEFITHISDVGAVSDTNQQLMARRMRGTGLFQDPNDLSLLIVSSSIVCTYFLQDRKLGAYRFLLLGPLAILAIGLLCTGSRGGLLAAGVGVLIWTVCRYGQRAAIVAGLLAVCTLPLITGRQAEINLEGGTGYERITLWREGLAALRSPQLVFGIGQGMYADLAGLEAHNSFVHAFVELGFVGGTLFLGCFFFPALTLYRLRHTWRDLGHPELQRMYPYIMAMLASWTMGLQALSRVYAVPTYLILGIQGAFANLAGAHLQPRRLLTSWDRSHLLRLLACSTVMFVGFNVFVLMFKR